MSQVKILIADDHQLVRAGLRLLLAEMADIEVVGEAANGTAAIALCNEMQPDLILMDIAMPVLGGLAALSQIHSQWPGVNVVMLSMHNNEEHVLEAFRLGATGYLLKDAAPAELELAIRAAMRGDTWISPGVSRPVVERSLLGGVAHAKPLLTPRQSEVLRLLAEGRSTKAIALALNLSVKTVETHRSQAMERIGVHDLAGLVRFAIRHGIVPA